MSNDTMPCGCEGHSDNASLCRYPGLEAALRQAERERDEANARALTMCRVQDEEMRARFLAEADNAALLGALRRLYHGYGDCIATAEDRAHARDALALPHPGAALLERVRLAERLRSLATHDEACHLAHNADWGTPDPERCAVCAFDAMEKKS